VFLVPRYTVQFGLSSSSLRVILPFQTIGFSLRSRGSPIVFPFEAFRFSLRGRGSPVIFPFEAFRFSLRGRHPAVVLPFQAVGFSLSSDRLGVIGKPYPLGFGLGSEPRAGCFPLDALRFRLCHEASVLSARFALGAGLALVCKDLVILALYRDCPGVFGVCTACRAVMVTGLDPALRARYASAC
jgi:hypothetical protein